ncbi:MAG TPA: translocation/assembly module TamB domain-containing protein [Burkholderiales bacterium]|nr:translocation/assembly module TamB domain-containing protein [Burkholderiales bacterium]
MRWLFAGFVVLLVALVAAVAGVGWLVGTEAGLHWAASKVAALRLEGLRGRLAGEVTAEKLTYETAEIRITAEKLGLRAHLAALLGGRLTIDPLNAAAIEIVLGERQGEAVPLKLPVRLHIANARADSIEVRRGAARYVVQDVHIDHARLGPELSLAGSLYWPHERFATRAKVQLGGSLERIEARVAADVAGVPAEARAIVIRDKLHEIEARAGPIDLTGFELAAQTALTLSLQGGSAAGGALAGTLSLENALAGAIDADRLPFTRLEARFLTDFASARLAGMRVAMHGGGTVQGDATVQPGSVQAKLVAAAIDLRSIHSRLRHTSLSGPLQVLVDGARQWARGSLTQEGIGLTAEVLRTGERVEVRELRALAEGGEVSGTGRMTLSGAKPFTAEFAVKRFNPASFGDYPAGSLSGAVVAAGRLEPRNIDFKWNLRDSVLYAHSFHSEGAARLVGERVTEADGELRLGANRLTARGAYGRPGDELAVALEAPRLEEFAPLAGSVRARGTLSGSLDNPRVALSAEAEVLTLPGGVQLQKVFGKLNGTLAAHEADILAQAPDLALEVDARLRGGWSGARGWVGEIRALKNSGAYPLELVAPAALRIAPGRIELGRLEARLADGRVLVHEAAWSPTRLASSGEFTRLPAQWVIVAAGMSERLSTTLRVDGEWELTRTKDIQGLVRMRRADGDLALMGERTIQLGLESASLEARFSGGRATALLEAVSPMARVRLQGDLMPELALQGKVEFADLGTLTRPFLEEARLDGRLSAELRASGTLASPLLHGTLKGEALAFELPAYGVALKEGSLSATLDGNHLRLESLAARGGEGRFSASGTLPLGLAGTARIAWRAEKLTVLDRPDMRLVASGEGEASYDGKRVSLTGDLRADRGHFELARERLPALGEDVVVLGRPAPPRKGRMRLPLALDLRLDLGNNLVVQGYGYDGKVAGLVDLATSKEGELRAFGRLHAVNATFLAYGQRLAVDPGVLIFDGPIDNPTLQITAWRRNQAVEAGVQLTGTARAPSVNLVSQPPVPEGERLSWLVLGRAPSGATQADLGLLQAAAGALLAGGDSVPLDRRIARRFGLDEVSLRGGGELTDRVVAVGKRLSDRLYISYEQGLGAVVTNLIKLDYALGRRWTLRAETGSSSGGGLFYRYSWD